MKLCETQKTTLMAEGCLLSFLEGCLVFANRRNREMRIPPAMSLRELARLDRRVSRALDVSAPPIGVRHISVGIAVGGAYRDRTDDLMLAKHALSQLS